MADDNESAALDLSAVLVVRNDEERVGSLTRGLLLLLRALGLRFEALVVDECSGDNTLAILSLCRPQLTEVEVLADAAPGRGLLAGAEHARGRAVLLLTSDSLAAALAGGDLQAPLLPMALSRVSPPAGAEAGDDVVVTRSYLLLRRSRTLPLLPALGQRRRRGLAPLVPGLLQRAAAAGLRVVRLERGPDYSAAPSWLQRLPQTTALMRARQAMPPAAALAALSLSWLRGLWRGPFDWLLNKP